MSQAVYSDSPFGYGFYRGFGSRLCDPPSSSSAVGAFTNADHQQIRVNQVDTGPARSALRLVRHSFDGHRSNSGIDSASASI